MSADRWHRIQTLFHAAIDLQPLERDAYLARECAGDPGLWREVAELLDAAKNSAASEFIGAAVRSASQHVAEPELRAGVRLDEYKLIRELGRGGMGSVWLGERADGAYTANVAVKLVHGGFSNSTFERRFRQERQILADLEHPNIARLIDGGTTAQGTPYLVMEYVEGQPILRWANERRLTLHQRLRLFLQVCTAVRHAHGSLVVHRDLKPSNILVRADGVPKLVDFGIAKLLGEPGQHQIETLSLVRLLTPLYASPEQLRGERITVATDIYSLGVLLYELVAAVHPFASDRAPPLELRRRILEDVPDAPSVALARAGSPHGVSARELQGDLDAIVLRAMQKDPSKRYASVAELMEDVRRHLADEPILARRSGWSERALRVVRRNVAMIGAAAILLVAGSTLVAWNTARLLRQRDAARAEAAWTERAVQLVALLLEPASDPAALGAVLRPNEAGAQAVAAAALRSLETSYSTSDARVAVARSRLGGEFARAGRYDVAEPLLLEANTALADNPAATEAERAAARRRLADLYDAVGRPADAARYRGPVGDAGSGR